MALNSKLRMTVATAQVLDALLERPQHWLSGAEIAASHGLMSGTLYPILHRLQQLGWLETENEDVDPAVVGRPRRRFYRLNADAARVARDKLESQRSRFAHLLPGLRPKEARWST